MTDEQETNFDQERDFYYTLIECDCGNEWYIIMYDDAKRGVYPCGECGLLHDVWIDKHFAAGSIAALIEYLRKNE